MAGLLLAVRAVREDLYYLWLALGTNKILKESSFALMISPKTDGLAPDAQSYGYGLAFALRGGKAYEYWHGGNEDWLGHNGMMNRSRLYVILSNSGESGTQSWSHRIEEGLRACANH